MIKFFQKEQFFIFLGNVTNFELITNFLDLINFFG